MWVRGCREVEDDIEEVSEDQAEFFGVYEADADGLHMWVADFGTVEEARQFAGL
jgi:hypothetical protein